jgi:hypothetical protein
MSALTFAPLKGVPPAVLSYREALVAWTPNTDQVRVGPLIEGPEHPDWTDPYDCTGGAAYRSVRDMEDHELIARMLADWHQLVVHYGIPVTAAHKAFLGVREYRDMFA